MNRSKLLSAMLAVLLAGYCTVSVALFNQLRDEISEAESMCEELESTCSVLDSQRRDLEKQLARARPEAGFQPGSADSNLARLRETLEFREMELAELSQKYESLQADYDALQERLGQIPGVDGLRPEDTERFRRFRGRFGEGRFSPQEMQQRRQERVEGLFDMLQERINDAPDENIRQNLLQIADSLGAIGELRQQLREAADDEARREIMSGLRDEGANLRGLAREERNLELGHVAKQFGINDSEAVQRFVDAVETVNNSPVQQLSRPRRMPFGRRGAR